MKTSRPSSASPTKPSQSPRSPYTSATLSTDAKEDLSVIVHFILLFHKLLDIAPHELLQNSVEDSLLSQSEKPFNALISFLATPCHRSPAALVANLSECADAAARLSYLRELIEKHAHHPDIRAQTVGEDGKVTAAARLRTGTRDSKGNAYTWLRGPDGCCSDRIIVTSNHSRRVIQSNEVMQVVEKLENGERRRADLLAASWLKERVDRAAARSRRVESAERERVEKEREMEELRKKKVERAKKQAGLFGGRQVDIEGFGRGRRERKAVTYEEDDWEDVSELEDEGGADGEEFTVESGEEGEGEASADDDGSSCVDSEASDDESIDDGRWSVTPKAAGRRRIVSHGRLTRARAKEVEKEVESRPVRKCRRLTRLSDM